MAGGGRMLNPSDLRKLKDKASGYVADGRFAKAAEIYEKICKGNPENLAAGQHLADMLLKTGEKKRALETYEVLADKYARGGFLLKAISLYRMILDIDPAHQQVQNLLAKLYAKQYGVMRVPAQQQAKKPQPLVIDSALLKPVRAAVEAPKEEPGPERKPAPCPEVKEAAAGRKAGRPKKPQPAAEQKPVAQREAAAGRPEQRPKTRKSEVLIFEESVIMEEAEKDEQAKAEVAGVDIDFESPELPPPPPPAQDDEDLAIEEVDILMEKDLADGMVVVEPAAQLPSIPIFSELGRAAFIALLNRLVAKRVEAGELIIREGEEGNSMYALVQGRVVVFKHDEKREKVKLAVLGSGEIFGEMALISGSRRVASVAAVTPCELLVISRSEYEKLVQQYPSIKKALMSFYRKRLLETLFAISAVFRALPEDEKADLLKKFKAEIHHRGDVIMREGQDADGLYLVMSGEVDTFMGKGSARMSLGVLREGAVFGEGSLLTRQPCRETVIVKRTTTLLVLSRQQFNEIILTHPLVLEAVSNIASNREDVLRRGGKNPAREYKVNPPVLI